MIDKCCYSPMENDAASLSVCFALFCVRCFRYALLLCASRDWLKLSPTFQSSDLGK